MDSRQGHLVSVGLAGVLLASAVLGSPVVQTDARIDEALKIFNHAKYLHQEGKYQEAAREYERAAKLDDKNPWIFNYLGLALTAAGNLNEAVAAYQRALELNPDLSDVHNNLGVAYSELGDRGRAFQEFTLAVRDPTYPTPEKALYNLGNLYFWEQNYELALLHYRRAVEKNAGFALGYRGMGKVHVALGELELAKEQFEAALEKDPRDQESLFEMGRVHDTEGNLAKAREYYLRVVETDRFSTFGRSALRRLEELKPGEVDPPRGNEPRDEREQLRA